eukprot:CAMPEP_0117419040 /NCGR_PEP_ID=MMETSP0758-20121206/700_1 /TAXON_ID=63605 /ORGANISM="Percolomonas cosmopolitus, Strain AE-1 (ATCC 50343)" /LENGTH=401 /DNA_ID=CAMNT_0005199903 /DNA_START=1218 /DNA_END=2423 /DNA_ORIENTATION=+
MIHCYTLEGNYITGKVVNHLGDLPPLKNGQKYAPQIEKSQKQSPRYTIEIYEDVGKGLATALLDMVFRDSNPYSRIKNSNLENLEGVAKWLEKVMSKKRKFWMGAKKGKVSSSSDDDDDDDENSDDDGSVTTTSSVVSSICSTPSSRSQPIGKPLLDLKPSKPQIQLKDDLLRMKEDSEDSSSENTNQTPDVSEQTDISEHDSIVETDLSTPKSDSSSAFDRLSKPRTRQHKVKKKTKRAKPLSQAAFSRLTAHRKDFSKLKTKYYNSANVKFDVQPVPQPQQPVEGKRTTMNLGYQETYQVTTKLLGKTPLQRASSYKSLRSEAADIRKSYPSRPMTSGNSLMYRQGKRSHAMMIVPPAKLDSKYQHSVLRQSFSSRRDQRATSAKRNRTKRRKKPMLIK